MAATTARKLRVGYRASITALFVGVVLLVGVSLVYLSFSRVGAITQRAASSYLDVVARLSATRIDAQFNAVRDCLEILRRLPPIQSGAVADDRRVYSVMASMLRSNKQLFNLYAGYDDGSFVEMDFLDRASGEARMRFGAPSVAAFRLVVIGAEGGASSISFLAEDLSVLARIAGPADYDPRKRPWYAGAFDPAAGFLTDPYVFFATQEAGYTLRMPIVEGRRGVVAGDIFLTEAEAMLRKERLGKSGVLLLFDDADRVLAYPDMSRHMADELPHLAQVDQIGLTGAVTEWRKTGAAQQFFLDPTGRSYAAAFQSVETAGSAGLRLGIFAPLDEFFSEIEAERRRLFLIALGYILAALPLVIWLGSTLSKNLRSLAVATENIQRFRFADTPQVHSIIREVDDLGRSVSTMRTLVETFSSFIPKRLVQELVETGTAMKLGGTRREVTLLFTDVANFTGITENANPDDVMLYTSRYFSVMADVMARHRGTIDKYIGDGIMAVWNAPTENAGHVEDACLAALACVEANRVLNAEFAHENWPAYHTRFGLHVGEAVVGNIGSQDRMNYTVLGAAVNLAARLESLNKEYGTTILVSEAVKRRVEQRFILRPVDRISPKGFAAEFTIFELRGLRETTSQAECDFVRDWEAVYGAITTKDQRQSGSMLAAHLAVYPGDTVAQCHSRRAGRDESPGVGGEG